MLDRTVSVMSFNLWSDYHWERRKEAIGRCIEAYRPDILCLQELHSISRRFLDRRLDGYDRVESEFPGWTCQGNIYWRTDSFAKHEDGTEEVGLLSEDKRLFWVRLTDRATDGTLLVGTAHLTHQSHDGEFSTGRSPRVEQARRIADTLTNLRDSGEPGVFATDLNDALNPRTLLADAGFVDCFSSLKLPPRATYPARPWADEHPDMPFDWIFATEKLRSRAALVAEGYYDGVPPSDHWPVVAVYDWPR